MPHPLIAAAMIATFIGAMLGCRQIFIAIIGVIGPNVAMVIVLICYALVCHCHRQERGY